MRIRSAIELSIFALLLGGGGFYLFYHALCAAETFGQQTHVLAITLLILGAVVTWRAGFHFASRLARWLLFVVAATLAAMCGMLFFVLFTGREPLDFFFAESASMYGGFGLLFALTALCLALILEHYLVLKKRRAD